VHPSKAYIPDPQVPPLNLQSAYDSPCASGTPTTALHAWCSYCTALRATLVLITNPHCSTQCPLAAVAMKGESTPGFNPYCALLHCRP
jgi:hypothetical protein